MIQGPPPAPCGSVPSQKCKSRTETILVTSALEAQTSKISLDKLDAFNVSDNLYNDGMAGVFKLGLL